SDLPLLRRLAALALALTGLGIASGAWAQPTAADRETARTLMEQGDKAYDSKDYASALKSYVAADALVSLTTTGIWVARTQMALGQLVEARDTALRVTRIPKAQGESATRAAARTEAEQLVQSLATRIPSLSVSVQGATAGATVALTVDGAAVPP